MFIESIMLAIENMFQLLNDIAPQTAPHIEFLTKTRVWKYM